MKCIIVKDSIVSNIIVIDSLSNAQSLFPDTVCLEWAEGINIGDAYVDGVFVPNVTATPDWPGFNLAISFDANMVQYEIVANAAHPSIVSKKDLAYSIIADKGLDNFAGIFPLFCQLAQVTPQHREEWAQLAESFSLPVEFVNIVRGNS